MGEEAIKILFLLMPGLIAIYIHDIIMASGRKDGNESHWLFRALAYNIPGFVITWLVVFLGNQLFVKLKMASCWDLSSLPGLISKLSSIKFVSFYLLASLVAGILVGYILAWENRDNTFVTKFFNWLRITQGKSDMLPGEVPWNKLVNNRSEPAVELIRSNGEVYQGFLRDFSTGNEPREFTIEDPETFVKWKDYLKLKCIYYHFDSDTLIKFYDTTEMKEKLIEMGLL